MNSSKYRFTLDLHSTQSQVSLPVTLGDTARVFLISLSDGGMPYAIAGDCLAMLSIKRPSGTILEAYCAIEGNTTIKYDFAQDEITAKTAIVPGVHDCTIVLIDTEGNQLASARFTMVVSERVASTDNLITDEDSTIINAMLGAEASRQTAETERVNAEASRREAENTRINAETLRQKAENGRIELVNQIKKAMAQGGFMPTYTTVKLLASAWKGAEDPYSQVVTIQGVTANSKVDLLPSVEQLAIFHDKDIAFVTENDGGTVTVFAIGDKPTQDYTMEVCVTEVSV